MPETFDPKPRGGPIVDRGREKAALAKLDPQEFTAELRLEINPHNWHGGYIPGSVNDRRLSDAQGKGVKLLREDLKAKNAELLNGRRVESHADALIWLLEQVIVKQMPLEKLP